MGDAAKYRKAIAALLVPLVTAAGAWAGISDPSLATEVASALAGVAVAVAGVVWAVPNRKP